MEPRDPGAPWPAPGQGQGPPPMPPGAWTPARAGMSAALILAAVGSILYALGCGCTTFSWSVILSGLGAAGNLPRDEAVKEMEAELDKAFSNVAVQSSNEEERRQREEVWRILKKHGLVGHTYDAFALDAAKSARGKLEVLGWLGVGLQIGFLVIGVMLFARARAARILGLLLCAAAFVVNVLTTLSFQEFAGVMVRHLGPVLEEVYEQEGAQGAGQRAPFEEFQQVLESGSEGGPIVFGGIACVWPFIMLLVLAVSSGIRRDLGLDPPEQAYAA